MGIQVKGKEYRPSARETRGQRIRAAIDRQRTQNTSSTVTPGSGSTNPAEGQNARGTYDSQKLEATKTPIQPETAEIKPTFSKAFKGNQNQNKDNSPTNANDQSRSNSQGNFGSPSNSLSRNLEAQQDPRTRNGQRSTQTSLGRDTSSSSREPSSLSGYETRIARLTQYRENIDRRAQRAEDVFRAVPGLRGDNKLQVGTRYALSIPGRLITEYPERIFASTQTGYAQAEGFLRSETRESTRRESLRALRETPVEVVRSNDPRDPRGFVNLGLTVFGIRSYAKGSGITGNAISELRKPQSFSAEMPGAPKAPIGDPLLSPRREMANPSRVTVGTRSQRLPESIREKIPFAIDKTRDPLTFSDITAKNTIITRRATTPEQAQAFRLQTVAAARKTFRNPSSGFSTSVLDDIIARQKADRVIAKKQSSGVLDTSGRRLLTPSEQKTFFDTIRTNRKEAQASEQARIAIEEARKRKISYNKRSLLGDKKGELRFAAKETDSGGLKLVQLEKPIFKVYRLGRLAPLVATGYRSKLASSQLNNRATLAKPTKPSQESGIVTKPSSDTKKKVASASVAAFAVRKSLPSVVQNSDTRSFIAYGISDLGEPGFPKRAAAREGGGGGGYSSRGGGARQRFKFDPSITAIELGITSRKKQSAVGYGGTEIRAVNEAEYKRFISSGRKLKI